MQRRDLFRSFHLPENAPVDQTPVPLVTVSRTAMGGEFEISYNKNLYPLGTKFALDALDEISRLEKKLSVFLADSFVSYMNTVAPFSAVSLDEELFELIRLSLEISGRTFGAVDITSTPLWKLWGFDTKKFRVPEPAAIAAALENLGSHLVQLDATARTVAFARPGVALSFGSVGKGFALDVASKTLENCEMHDFLFHGGMSSVCARGNFRPECAESGWTIGVAHPMRPGERLAEIQLVNESLGTSGSQKQFFRHNNRRYSHVLDPRSGHPAEHVLMVTVVAETAFVADALSTAFFVLEPDEVQTYCSEHPGVAALLLLTTSEAPGYKISTFGFREGQLRFPEAEQHT